MPEAMSTSRWSHVRLQDVVERHQEISRNPLRDGFTRFLKVEHMDQGLLRLSRWGDIEEEELPPTFYNVFRKGHVLFPSRNPHLRRTVWPDFDGICGEKTFVLRAREGLLQELLPFIMQSDALVQHAVRMKIGSTNPHVRWRDLASYEFALPPLEEQRRIATTLAAHIRACEALHLLGEKQAVALQSLYQHAFGPLREHLHNPKGTKLSELTEIRRGASPRPIEDKKWFSEEGPGWVRIRDLREDSMYLRETEQRLSPAGVEKSVPVSPGEVILSIAATIGKPVIVDAPVCVHDGFVVLRQFHSDLDRDYLYHFLRWLGPVMEAKGLVGTQKNINTTIVGHLRIPVSNKTTQRHCAALMTELFVQTVRTRARARKLASLASLLISGS